MTTTKRTRPDIGKTSSGKPIHDPSHAVYQTARRMPKWNIVPTALHEPKILKETLAGWSRRDHEEAAELHESRKTALDKTRDRLIAEAGKKHGAGQFGRFVSGGYQEFWPEAVKDKLGDLAYRAGGHGRAAWAHRVAMGFRDYAPRPWMHGRFGGRR